MKPLVGAACAAFSIVVAWWAVSGERTGAGARNLAIGLGRVTDMRRAVLDRSASDRTLAPLMASLARFGRRLTPAGMISTVERRILVAGSPAAWTMERVMATKTVFGGGALLLGGLRFLGSPSAKTLLIALLLTAGGWFVPDLILQGRGQRRQIEITRSLPDVLDQLTISVEAGLGFEAAMASVAARGEGPLAEELTRALQDVQTGMSRAEAMRKLGERVDVADLRQFIGAVLQADGYGIPIAQVLRIQSAELRVKRRQEAEERAMKIPVKVIFPLIVCILPTLFIVVMGPGAIRLVRTFSG